jgi:hypothetical protein
METLRRVLALPAGDRRLILRAAWLVLLLRVALLALPFRAFERLVARLASPRVAEPMPAARVAWAVAAIGRRLPGATCLVQALAARILLGRQGTPALVRIGVAREPGGRLKSHAWVESEGAVVLGDVHLDRYIPIATWGGP